MKLMLEVKVLLHSNNIIAHVLLCVMAKLDIFTFSYQKKYSNHPIPICFSVTFLSSLFAFHINS